MGATSIWHWLIVLLIIALVFGTRKLRNMGSDVGHAIREFKEGMNETSKSKNDSSSELMLNDSAHSNVSEEQQSTEIKSNSTNR